MSATFNLYESPALKDVTGPTLRPGGMTLTKRAFDFCRLCKGKTVLDIGCGIGATADYLQRSCGLNAIGIDFSLKLLTEAKKLKHQSALIHGRAEHLPITDGRLDAICSECVLSLLECPKSVLSEWYRALALGGYLIISDLYARPSKEGEGKLTLPVNCCLNGAVSAEILLARMRWAGFKVVLFEDHTLLLKQFTAQLVWRYGSFNAFWSDVNSSCSTSVKNYSGRPGYYLMIGRKKE